MEQLQDCLSSKFLMLEKPELIKVCSYLKCSEPAGEGFPGQTRRALIRLAEKTIDEIEEGLEEERYAESLNKLLNFIGSLKEPAEHQTSLVTLAEIEKLRKEYAELQQAQANARHALEEQIGLLEEQSQRGKYETNVKEPRHDSIPEVTLRREFRVFGQIGEAGQKDKLSYTSLNNQIKSGVRKGYAEAEIIEAVIRAVSPGLPLRELLEMKRDLTLATLKTILRGHYKIDSSSDLLHRLMNISQEPKESAQSFLFQAIELREKLLWASGDEQDGEQFSPELIQRKFLRSVETGLLNDAVKFQVKPYLSDPKVADEVLIEKIGEAANLELERQAKLKKAATPKPFKINEMQAVEYICGTNRHVSSGVETQGQREETSMKESIPGKEKKKQVQSKDIGSDTTTKAIEDLRVNVMEMTKMFRETMEATRSQFHPSTPLRTERRWTSIMGLSTTEANIGKREGTAELDPPVVHPVIGSQDTGAQASIINADWRKRHLPYTTVRPIEELLGPGTLTGLAANHTEIPFDGWVEVSFRLSDDGGTEETLQVPMLVASDASVAENPIVGYNVIEEIIGSEPSPLPEGLMIQEGVVKVGNEKTAKVPIAIANTAKHPVILTPRLILGHLEVIKSTYPVTAGSFQKNKTEMECVIKQPTSTVQTYGVSVTPQKSEKPSHWDPPIKLEYLTETRQQIVRQLLREECNAFSFDDNDVGCIPSLNMHITLHDKTPVQKTYISVPKPLLQEVKEYLQDLLNRGWVSKSRSPYSSPVVCVRKKDGSLRLCCDYRELNRKSVPDRHPIPRIQDMLDSLSGSSWFSVLDQGKAYHQGFLDAESRPLTAFITPWGLFEWNRIPFGLSSS
ncbi:hypothetical protein QQF64_017355 [Cirrhinus molitorella]|uniref:ribonuclease H n=1 Tax=Cirrhinus molitorella TaxID=172907 RepID=A0ABR3LIE8_9TELE